MTRIIIIATALAALTLAPSALAQTPVGTAFTYQGRLVEGGVPANGTYDLQFRVFDGAAAGIQVGPLECRDNVTVTSGLFTVSLDFGAVFAESARWLEIRVRPDATAGNCMAGSYTVLAPRQRIGSAPSALFSQAPWATSSIGDVSYTAGNVGIGTSTPSNRLTVANETDNNSILAIDSGATATQSSILRFHDRGDPVWSLLKNASNDFAIRETGPGVDRLYVEHDGNVGIGTSNPQAKLHVRGAWSGAVIVADATGVDEGAVLGNASANGGFGVAGQADATGGTGVFGHGPSSSGYGVYSSGRFTATGTKAFQIDHPLDPAGHYLNHYCTEGPEPQNVYNGTVVLGPAGCAWVTLPDYFGAINTDLRYQLTCIGGFAPVYIAHEVEHNRFMIAGGVEGLKVSWEVKGVRNDAFVRAYRAPVEVEKPASRKGTYLHPELFGRPQDEAEHARFRK